MPGASFSSTMAGWHEAAALKGVPACEERLTILPPQPVCHVSLKKLQIFIGKKKRTMRGDESSTVSKHTPFAD